MKRGIDRIQDKIATALNALPEVFSTVQWGGRAYKLPGPGGSKRKPKLLAHIWLEQTGGPLCVAFKLPKPRADEAMERYDWVQPHSFRTLAPSGWMIAEVATMAQCEALIGLLKESHALHPVGAEPHQSTRRRKQGTGDDGVIRRIESVVAAKKEMGWTPGDFEPPTPRKTRAGR